MERKPGNPQDEEEQKVSENIVDDDTVAFGVSMRETKDIVKTKYAPLADLHIQGGGVHIDPDSGINVH